MKLNCPGETPQQVKMVGKCRTRPESLNPSVTGQVVVINYPHIKNSLMAIFPFTNVGVFTVVHSCCCLQGLWRRNSEMDAVPVQRV